MHSSYRLELHSIVTEELRRVCVKEQVVQAGGVLNRRGGDGQSGGDDLEEHGAAGQGALREGGQRGAGALLLTFPTFTSPTSTPCPPG